MPTTNDAELRAAKHHRSLSRDCSRTPSSIVADASVKEMVSTARTVKGFTDEPVDDATLESCLEAAKWVPSRGGAPCWRFIVLRSHKQRAATAAAAARSLAVIEPFYGLHRPSVNDVSELAATHRAIYDFHDRAGEYTSVLLAEQKSRVSDRRKDAAPISAALQKFLHAARTRGLGACPTSWVTHGEESPFRAAVGICDDWILFAHIMIGW